MAQVRGTSHCRCHQEAVAYGAHQNTQAPKEFADCHLPYCQRQMTRATANAAPAHHVIAEAKYDDDFGNPFGSVAVYFLLTSIADKHVQKRLDSMLEQLGECVASDVKRAVHVGAYLERIHIQYLDLIKAKENLTVLYSRILPKVLVKLSDGRHVGSDRLD